MVNNLQKLAEEYAYSLRDPKCIQIEEDHFIWGETPSNELKLLENDLLAYRIRKQTFIDVMIRYDEFMKMIQE